jgi:hypothetical protein
VKCDRRWYNDGRVERDAREQERREDGERGVKRWYNERGELVCIESPECTFWMPHGRSLIKLV